MYIWIMIGVQSCITVIYIGGSNKAEYVSGIYEREKKLMSLVFCFTEYFFSKTSRFWNKEKVHGFSYDALLSIFS